MVPNLGVNYPPGAICGSSGGNAEPKPQCCSVLWAITGKEIFDMKSEKFLVRVIRHDRYLDLGNVSTKFGNHCFKSSNISQTFSLDNLWGWGQEFATFNGPIAVSLHSGILPPLISYFRFTDILVEPLPLLITQITKVFRDVIQMAA